MGKAFKTAGLIVLGALVLVLLLTGVGHFTGRPNFATRAFQTAAAPVEKLLGRGLDRLGDLKAALTELEELRAENAALKAEIAGRMSFHSMSIMVRASMLMVLQYSSSSISTLDLSSVSL